MIYMLIIRCWPALIPIALYLLWFYTARRKAKRAGEPLPHIMQGPWLWTAIATILTLAVILFAIPLSSHRNEGTGYQPKQLIDGKLVPGHLN